MSNDINQWVTQSEVAKMKGVSLPLLAYHLKKPDAPAHEVRYGKKVYKRSEVESWRL